MKEFSAVAAPVMTFYSRPFYKDVAINGKGLGFAYLFLILLICWTTNCVHIATSLGKEVASKECTSFVEQIPGMTWTEGKLSIDKSCPYAINSRSGPVIVFDTSGKFKTLADAAPAQILFTTDSVILSKSHTAEDKTEESVPWKQIFSNFKMGPDSIKEFLTKLPLWLGVFAWVLGLFVFVGHMLVALVLGAIGLIMDRNKRGYTTAVRLASFAMTPAIIISTVRDLVSFTIPMWPCISFVISVAFLYLAFSSVNQDAESI